MSSNEDSPSVASPAVAPPVVATIGMHGSASTWVFNVVRELMIAVAGEAAVLPIFADEVAQLPDDAERAGRHLLIKSHQGTPQLEDWLTAAGARLVLSVRDPRDAVLSLSQRFKTQMQATTRWIAYDCARIGPLAAQGHAVIRYENHFFNDPGTITELADWLGLQVDTTTQAAIFGRYRTETVRQFAENLATLPPERLTTAVAGQVPMDKVTQILSSHIGDGRCGKWRELPEAERAELTRMFVPFLDQFRYEH